MSVYQPCDIRGPVVELSAELYRKWGYILGRQAKRFVVGGDVRTHTPAFLAALTEGLISAGAKVDSLGILPTPLVYLAKRQRGYEACAIVTASHNPPEYNGLKWMIGSLPPTEADVEAIRRASEELACGDIAVNQSQPDKIDIWKDYIAWLGQQFGHSPLATGERKMRVIIDPGHGCFSGLAMRAIAAVFPGIEAMAIFDTPDGNFPGRDPDSAKPKHLDVLCKRVRENGADAGIAFDGDGDRAAFVDGEGVALSAEQATWLLLQSLGDKLRGRPVVYDLKFSDLVARTARELGGLPRPEQSGHAFIRTTMIRNQAVFGAEISGHYFYEELDCGDDGLYSALRVLDYVARGKRSLADLRKACPQVYITADLRLRVPIEQRRGIIEQARQAFLDRPQTQIDGTRIDFDDGWALIRSSVTEPSLTLRFEGTSSKGLDAVVDRFCKGLGSVGESVQTLYRKSHGA